MPAMIVLFVLSRCRWSYDASKKSAGTHGRKMVSGCLLGERQEKIRSGRWHSGKNIVETFFRDAALCREQVSTAGACTCEYDRRVVT